MEQALWNLMVGTFDCELMTSLPIIQYPSFPNYPHSLKGGQGIQFLFENYIHSSFRAGVQTKSCFQFPNQLIHLAGLSATVEVKRAWRNADRPIPCFSEAITSIAVLSSISTIDRFVKDKPNRYAYRKSNSLTAIRPIVGFCLRP
ncbi:hypothetical protein [Roseivirga pacifica]|uniref:hypothetical protein n=1 Tax=Roseivirga pacifica TaxID=1267423 RepID=UPI00227C780C|nr:hypothetical protein [Roseivirga pacifica]